MGCEAISPVIRVVSWFPKESKLLQLHCQPVFWAISITFELSDKFNLIGKKKNRRYQAPTSLMQTSDWFSVSPELSPSQYWDRGRTAADIWRWMVPTLPWDSYFAPAFPAPLMSHGALKLRRHTGLQPYLNYLWGCLFHRMPGKCVWFKHTIVTQLRSTGVTVLYCSRQQNTLLVSLPFCLQFFGHFTVPS